MQQNDGKCEDARGVEIQHSHTNNCQEQGRCVELSVVGPNYRGIEQPHHEAMGRSS